MAYASHSIGSHIVPVTPVTFSKLYWSTCISKLCYGVEICQMSDNVKAKFNGFHKDMAKHCQFLPINTANAGALSGVGWKSIEAHCDIIKLCFLWRLLLLPIKCIYKILLVRLLSSHILRGHNNRNGPIAEILQIVKKYEFYNVVKDSVFKGK